MKTAKILKIIGLLPIGFMSLVFVVFGIGEFSSGDFGGLMHLIQFVLIGLMIGLLIWLCWIRPLWGGILLLAVALFRLLTLIPEVYMPPAGSIWSPSFFLLILIPAISGGLFLYAGLLEHKGDSVPLP